MFYRIFALHDSWHLVLLLGFSIAMLYSRSPLGIRNDTASWAPDRISVTLLAGAAGTVSCALWWLALHGLPFAMDEFAAVFQATLFASGRVLGELPEQWRPFANALTPIFVNTSQDGASWVATYTPGYALVRAPFEFAGVGWLLNPVLGAASVFLIHHVGMRLWPGERQWAWTAAALLAVSPQVLLTSASAYSMPAHLTLNLAWLALYLRRSRVATVSLGLVGALALSLHNPFPHALFVAPFLLRLLRERRWGTLAYLLVVYGATSFALLRWLHMVHPVVQERSGGFLSSFSAPGSTQLVALMVSAFMLIAWQSPIAFVGWYTAATRHTRLEAPLQDAALGFFLTVTLYLLFPFDQGHGWGYRYAHGVLGNLALLAAAGLRALASAQDPTPVRRTIVASLCFTALAVVPLRAAQVRALVGPFARAHALVSDVDADLVVVPTHELWYGPDLVRNDPLLRNRPLIAGAAAYDDVIGRTVHRQSTNRTRRVTVDELTALGMTRLPSPAP
jgi:hypothetical protein